MNSHRTRVKICGITRAADAQAAADAGADAIGLVFYAPSPRFVDLHRAAEIAHSVPPFVTVVGLFVDPSAEYVEQVRHAVPLGMLQFHGDEPADFCERFRVPYLKALRVRIGVDLLQFSEMHTRASAILVDAYRQGIPGGTGETFDWALIPEARNALLVLSGGLRPDNVAAAIRRVRPWAVDVSSGVEAAPGIKDAHKVRRFIDEATRIDSLLDKVGAGSTMKAGAGIG